jgi:hypothetical protein
MTFGLRISVSVVPVPRLTRDSRLLTYVVPANWLAGQSWASLVNFWYLSQASITVQALIDWLLLRHQLDDKLKLFTVPA